VAKKRSWPEKGTPPLEALTTLLGGGLALALLERVLDAAVRLVAGEAVGEQREKATRTPITAIGTGARSLRIRGDDG
jgi:hypothetical protein